MDTAFNDIVEKIIAHAPMRRTAVAESHEWFFAIYFADQLEYLAAPFHRTLFEITESDAHRLAVVVAFRGSAKSTIMTRSYPIWAILGKQQKKFVLIVAQTQEQGRLYLNNIKDVLESNALLKADLGPFEEPDDEWRSMSIVIPKYGARITVASVDQKIRGIQHCGHRPDLIICDDIEDVESSRTREGREKLWRWYTGELAPVGDLKTNMLVVGNLVHEDCLIMRLKEKIKTGATEGIFRRYPIIDGGGMSMWPGKYPTLESIDIQRKKVAVDVAWHREYLLEIIPEEDQVINPAWILSYDVMPSFDLKTYAGTFIGVDPAISKRETADYTAMVVASVFGYGKDSSIFIHPFPVNERLTFLETENRIRWLVTTVAPTKRAIPVIEKVAYQEALIESVRSTGIKVEASPTYGADKRSRLIAASGPMEAGKVFFPLKGCEALIQQLVGFGKEKHDDLADAFAIVVRKAASLEKPFIPEVFMI